MTDASATATATDAAASHAPALQTRDLAVGYCTRSHRHTVLEHVTVSVAPGELVCLLGPNGIGKSTLVRTLARMQPALHGAVEIGGAPLEALSGAELARRLGVVLTERVAVESLRVRQVVALGRYPHSGWLGGLDARDQRVVEWALDAVALSHLADRDFDRISDGERQRVMVARALAQEPALLMLDEPTAFLDVSARVELMALLRRLTRTGALAVVVSTHDLELALRVADLIWLVTPDREMATGAPEDLMASGAIARAFEGRQVRFDAQARAFRWSTGDRGVAAVEGIGVRADLARAVLEREGYAVVENAPRALTVHVDDGGWRVFPGGGGAGAVMGAAAAASATDAGAGTDASRSPGADASGSTFRELAAHLRTLVRDNERAGARMTVSTALSAADESLSPVR